VEVEYLKNAFKNKKDKNKKNEKKIIKLFFALECSLQTQTQKSVSRKHMKII